MVSKTMEIKGKWVGVCFLGSTPAGQKWDASKQERLRGALRQFILWVANGSSVTLHSGLEVGPEMTWATEAALARRALGDVVRFEAHVQGPANASRWKPEEIRRWRNLQKQADRVRTCKVDNRAAAKFDRDRAMVEASDIVLILWDGVKVGHTWELIEFARMNRRIIYFLDPITLETWVDNTPLETYRPRPAYERNEGLAPDGRPLGFDGTSFRFVCPVCGAIVVKTAAFGRRHRKRGNRGPFCSRKCAGFGSSPRHRRA